MANTALRYACWYIFFYLQGIAISLALEKQILLKQLVNTLFCYILVKLILMLSDVFEKYIISNTVNSEVRDKWAKLFPREIYRDNEDKHNQLLLLFFDYLPRVFNIKIKIIINFAIIFSVLIAALILFISTKFYLGLLALITIFILNGISKNFFIYRIGESEKKSNEIKSIVCKWIFQFFSSYKEIEKNWHTNKIDWGNQVYEKYYETQKEQITSYLLRDLVSQALIELPFLINTSVVIFSVYMGFLSIQELFVWIGFSQFMIHASNAYLENRVYQKQANVLNTRCGEVIDFFKSQTNFKNVDKNKRNYKEIIVLKDGTQNILDIKNGIYPLNGANGSGKTTLLNIILGYEREHNFFSLNSNERLFCLLDKSKMRIIERNPVLFDCLNDFYEQLFGPKTAHHFDRELEIKSNIEMLFSHALAIKWLDVIKDIKKKYYQRNRKEFSSGEKIIISCLRFFASWVPEARILVIDECESFLDSDKKQLFFDSLIELSNYLAIYITSHEMQKEHQSSLYTLLS